MLNFTTTNLRLIQINKKLPKKKKTFRITFHWSKNYIRFLSQMNILALCDPILKQRVIQLDSKLILAITH